ncbi:Disease resistance protein RPS5 [Spatholobus suberectus]|nr:Disease resistance protein RPS5 [Spatholobus suberectus]
MLEQLVVKECNEWEEIISLDSEEASELGNDSAPSHQICFPSLRKIEIEGCNRLKAVFSSTIVTRLPMLEQLFVKECSEWEDIISLDSQEARQLRNQSMPFQQVCFPKLRKIVIKSCNKLKAIFSSTIVTRLPRLPNLQSLSVDDCNNLEAIISPYSMEAVQHRNLSAPQQVCFPKLGRITIRKCSKLKNIFFRVILSSLPKLKSVCVLECNELEDIISSEAKPLRNLSTSSQQLYFPTLQSIDIKRCNKLKTIFSLTIVRSLPKLGSLSVNDCNELEEIFSLDSVEAGQVAMISAPPPQQVCLPKIHSIRIKICNKLKCIFPCYVACHCSSLDLLDIESCSQLEQIVKFEHKATSEEEGAGVAVDDNHGKHLLFPNLGWLELKKLPTLTGTFPWYEPQNCHMIIEDCPKCLWST